MKFSKAVQRFLGLGDFNNPDMDRVDELSAQLGISQKQGREAFFTARDLQALGEYEKLEGGTGKVTKSVNRHRLLEAIFAKGERK